MTRCCFVPPIIEDNLKAAGIAPPPELSHVSAAARLRRNMKPRLIATKWRSQFSAVGAIEPTVRVYDCEKTWQLRKSQVWSGKVPEIDEDSDEPPPDIFKHLLKGSDARYAAEFGIAIVKWLKGSLHRNGINDRGSDVIINVNFGEGYNNAFWDGNELTLGGGDGRIFGSFAKSPDVVAHEIGHGIIQEESALEYEGESGALNEHFADVLGIAIQNTLSPPGWLIGDEIMGWALRGEALRSMIAPGTAYDNRMMGKDPQPGHMDNLYEGDADHGGVHINSGIPNRAFAIAAERIGIETAARVWYTALPLLAPRSTLRELPGVIDLAARELIIRRAEAMEGENGEDYAHREEADTGFLKAGDLQAIRDAFRQVGLMPGGSRPFRSGGMVQLKGHA